MSKNISKLLKIMQRLRHPKKGCPWDQKQNLQSIITHSIEEVYELADEIYKNNYIGIKEELGDLLFQVIYLSQIAKEKKKFNFNDVVVTVTKKMLLRHPHVFKNKEFNNINDLENWWEKSKNKKSKNLLDNIPKSLPSMLRAHKIQIKVAKKGFDYISKSEAVDKVIEEANELKKEIKDNNRKKIKEELGDLIFSILDVSRKLELNPEMILSDANKKFEKRWKKIENFTKKEKVKLEDLTINDYNKYWEKAKN